MPNAPKSDRAADGEAEERLYDSIYLFINLLVTRPRPRRSAIQFQFNEYLI